VRPAGSVFDDFEHKAVREWRAIQPEKALDRGRLKFTMENDLGVRKVSRARTVYSKEDDELILEYYGTVPARDIAEILCTDHRPVTRNMVIGRYNRIKDRFTPEPIALPAMEDLPKRIERAVSCATVGCSHIPVKYSSHGMCPQCNARRLNSLPRDNCTREITAGASW